MLLKRIASNSLDKTFLVFGLSNFADRMYSLRSHTVELPRMIRYTCAYYERPDMTLDEAQEAPFKLEKTDGLRNELLYSFELMYTVSIDVYRISRYIYTYIIFIYTSCSWSYNFCRYLKNAPARTLSFTWHSLCVLLFNQTPTFDAWGQDGFDRQEIEPKTWYAAWLKPRHL